MRSLQVVRAGRGGRLGALLVVFGLLFALGGRAWAHPGNVVATLRPRVHGSQVQLEAVLTFDGTGEPLLGARLSWSALGSAERQPFGFGGGPNVQVSTLPLPTGTSRYTLHILSLGETTEADFSLTARGDRLSAEPRDVLLLFPDVGLPEYQLVLVVTAVLVGMMMIIVRKPGGRGVGMLCLALSLAILPVPGCARKSQQTQSGLEVRIETIPSPPVVGEGVVIVRVADEAGAPLSGAKVSVEGTMAHAGMASTYAVMAPESMSGSGAGSGAGSVAGSESESASGSAAGSESESTWGPTSGTGTGAAPGFYRGRMRWTMGGDWVLIVRVAAPDGRVLEQRFPVAGVRSAD